MKKLSQGDNHKWRKGQSYIFNKTNINIFIYAEIEYTEEKKLIIIKQFHDAILGNHLRINKTITNIKKQFQWKGMKNDVKDYIKNSKTLKNKTINGYNFHLF